MKKALFIILLASVASGAQASEFLYILSAKAKLLAHPSFKAETVQNVTKGEKVKELAKNNNWFQVEYKGKVGWLSRLSVSPNPPMKRVSLLAKNNTEDLANESRRRASSLSTTAAVRGLRTNDRARVSDGTISNYDALARMESINVSDDEVSQFLATIDR